MLLGPTNKTPIVEQSPHKSTDPSFVRDEVGDLLQKCILFRTKEMEGFIQFKRKGHCEIHPILSDETKVFLETRHIVSTLPKEPQIAEVQRWLNVHALSGDEIHQIHTRVARIGDAVYFDLGTSDHTII